MTLEGGLPIQIPGKVGVRASFAHDNQMVINSVFGTNYMGYHNWPSFGAWLTGNLF